MSFCSPLNPGLSPNKVGHKFANLGRASEKLAVPRAICITVGAFREALGAERIGFLEEFFDDLRATVGSFLLPSMSTVQQTLEGLTLTEPLRAELYEQLIDQFGGLEGRSFAVRSSGATEDTSSLSFAGVYTSQLEVRGFDHICEAVVQCWEAYYSYPAIAARVRADQYDSQPNMAVIVQEMVPAQLAGVAFSNSAVQGGVVVEYVRGLGDALVSGTVTPTTYRVGDNSPRPATEQKALEQVRAAVSDLENLFGHAVDVEWAWEGQSLYVLQVRPVTALLEGSTMSDEPFFAHANLYSESGLPPNIELGECKEVYASYVAKRADAYQLAETTQTPTGAAHVVSFNGLGLSRNEETLERLLRSSPASQVVLDLSPNIRQVIIDKTEVLEYLQDTFGLTHNAASRHTVILRDFLQGDYGFISRLVDNTDLLVEYSEDGLLGINRGTAQCKRIVVRNAAERKLDETLVNERAAEKDAESFQGALPRVLTFTQALNRELPETQLEWVLEAGEPYFVDFSREQVGQTFGEQVESVVVSPGVARGPVFRVGNNEMLSRLSIGPAVSVSKSDEALEHEGLQALVREVSALPRKPILFADRPYAILSTLFDYVSGFVFNEGSLLCHLAILLREAELPAVIDSSNTALNGDDALIVDGQLIISPATGTMR